MTQDFKKMAEELFNEIDDIASAAGSIFGLPGQGAAREAILKLITAALARGVGWPMDNWEKIAEELLPCTVYCKRSVELTGTHNNGCPQFYRPAVAAALAQVAGEKDKAELAALKSTKDKK